MKTKSILIRFFVAVLLTGAYACKSEDNPIIATCRLTSTTDQLVEVSGQLTDEMKRTFTYTGSTLASLAEKSKSQDAGFQVTYADNRVTRATNGQDVVTLAYGSTSLPSSSTFSRGGNLMSTFTMEYDASGRMTKVVENRQVLPANTLTTQRAFTFTYDNSGNLTNERVRFLLNDGSVVEQETEYVFDAKPSPYKRFSELPLLTVVALSQAVETRPGRFWHINAPASLKSYNLTSTGTRSNLRESSTFTPVYDSDNKLMSQDQNALLYQISTPTPITKKNRQSFAYQCE